MKYTIAIAALLGLIQANEIYDAPVNATAPAFADKKAMAKAESDEDDDDSDSTDAQEDSSSDVQADSSSDAQEDSSSDVQADSSSDAQEDSSSDVQADSSSDAQADSSSDVQEDSSSDAQADSSSDAQADSSSDAQADSSSDAQEDSSSDVQADSSSDAQEDSSSDVQVAGDDESSDHSGEFFEAREHGTGPLDKKYERVVPSHFAEASDDLFMRSMIKTYALEGKNKDGSPNGQFFMDEATTRAAASEVLETHKGLKGGAKNDYLKTYFPRTWAHFDVNKTGKVGVEVMPQFMRFLASDQTLSL